MPDTTPTLRDRIRRAICEASGFTWLPDELMEPDEYGEHAGAVLAVLPEPVDRAAVLREAAALLVAHATTLEALSSSDYDNEAFAANHLRSKAVDLHRMADEAQPATDQPTEAHPTERTWANELHDPLADEWVPGTRYLVRERAVNHLEHSRKIAPTWKDGTPTQRRLVRATTTYTVEPAADRPDTETQAAK